MPFRGFDHDISCRQDILRFPCGLYYKHITIVIDAPSVASKWRSKLERHLLTIVIDDAS
jgi:hypothetical protein